MRTLIRKIKSIWEKLSHSRDGQLLSPEWEPPINYDALDRERAERALQGCRLLGGIS